MHKTCCRINPVIAILSDSLRENLLMTHRNCLCGLVCCGVMLRVLIRDQLFVLSCSCSFITHFSNLLDDQGTPCSRDDHQSAPVWTQAKGDRQHPEELPAEGDCISGEQDDRALRRARHRSESTRTRAQEGDQRRAGYPQDSRRSAPEEEASACHGENAGRPSGRWKVFCATTHQR